MAMDQKHGQARSQVPAKYASVDHCKWLVACLFVQASANMQHALGTVVAASSVRQSRISSPMGLSKRIRYAYGRSLSGSTLLSQDTGVLALSFWREVENCNRRCPHQANYANVSL